MNERIKELAKLAEKYADEETNAFTDDSGQWKVIWNETYDKKFAELIINECAEQIKTHNISASSEGYGDYEIGFNVGLFHAFRTIKEHFGVNK